MIKSQLGLCSLCFRFVFAFYSLTTFCIHFVFAHYVLYSLCIRSLRFVFGMVSLTTFFMRFLYVMYVFSIRYVYDMSTLWLRFYCGLYVLSVPFAGPRNNFWVQLEDFWKNDKILCEFVRFAYGKVEFDPDFSVCVRSGMCDECFNVIFLWFCCIS